MKTKPNSKSNSAPPYAHQTGGSWNTVTVIGDVPLSLATRISEIHAMAIAASEGVRQIQDSDTKASGDVRRTNQPGQAEDAR